MVHALEEVWRTLRPDGMLVDLRPVNSRPGLDVFVGDIPQRAGAIDDSLRDQDDLAAHAAIDQVLAAGLFEQEAKFWFYYPYCWPTLEQMMVYFEENWSKHAAIPPDVLQKAQQLVAQDAFDSKICVQRTMLIATYRKR